MSQMMWSQVIKLDKYLLKRLLILIACLTIIILSCHRSWAQDSSESVRSSLEEIESNTKSNAHQSLVVLVRDVVSSHPAARARRFELQAAQVGLQAHELDFAPQLSGSLELNDDLVSLPNPLNMGIVTPFETRRYIGELRISKPFQWGTQLSLSVRQGQIETTNPFRNCVPGIMSERCYDSSITLSLSQSLLRGRDTDANLAPRHVATAQKSASEAALRAEVRRLVEQAVSAYLQLSLAQAQLALEQRELRLTERQLEEAQVRISAGVIAASDLFPLQSAVAQRQQSLISAQGRARSAQGQLNALLTHLEKVEMIEAHLPRAILDPERALALAQLHQAPLEKQHPELLALDAQITQLVAQRASLRDQERPLLDLALVWSQSGLGEELGDALAALPNNESRFYGVTLNYQQPLSQRAQLLTAQLEAQIKARRADRDTLIRRLQTTWEDATSQLREKIQGVHWARKAAKASIMSAEAAKARFEAGRGTLFESLELQSRALAAQTQVLIIEHEVANQTLTLLSLSGELLGRFGVEVDVNTMSPTSQGGINEHQDASHAQ